MRMPAHKCEHPPKVYGVQCGMKKPAGGASVSFAVCGAEQSARAGVLRYRIHGVERLARRHEQAVSLRPPKQMLPRRAGMRRSGLSIVD